MLFSSNPMKHLFLVISGQYDFAKDTINDKGIEQMKEVAAAIKQITGNQSKYIISSPDYPEYDSAEVLSKELGLKGKFEKNPYFVNFNGKQWRESYEHSMAVINSKKELADNMVIVSNEDMIEALFMYFMKKFDKEAILGSGKPGTAIDLDLEKRIYQPIPKRE